MPPKIYFIVALLTWAAASSSQAQEVGSAQRGLRVAREACSQCHLVVKEAGRSTDPNAPTFEIIAKTSGMTRAALIVTLRTSHQTMPHVIIKAEDLKDLVAYIVSLKDD
jgi:mono/diheme cytochrome c family protein